MSSFDGKKWANWGFARHSLGIVIHKWVADGRRATAGDGADGVHPVAFVRMVSMRWQRKMT